MTENAILHLTNSQYSFPVSLNSVKLRLRLSKKDTPNDVFVNFGGKYDFAQKQFKVRMEKICEDRLFAYYGATVNIDDPRLAYVFEINENGKTYYYSEDGLTKEYDFEYNYYNSFQLAYINECDVLNEVEWLKSATFYQIFIDRFARGDFKKNDGYINLEWGQIPTPKSFAGGDLKGITNKLTYLKNLGVTCLYLTPVFKSVSNHKYDTENYYEIDSNFGDEKVLKNLVDEAHNLGIKIVLDAVFNHCSENCAEFKDVKKRGENSPYYDFFIRKNGENDKFECFGDCEYMPKFNTSNPKVRKFLIDVAIHWTKKLNVDGWRLDVSDEISHLFWREFRQKIKELNPDCALIGENWHNANEFLRGDQFDGIMNYAFTKACLDFFAFESLNTQDFSNKLNEILMRNGDTANSMMLNLLDSHDTHRFLTRVNGSVDKLKAALALEFFFPGAACVYYGTENAMEGGYDPDSRRCFDWTKENDNSDLKELIKCLSNLKARRDFFEGDFKVYQKNGLLFAERSSKNILYRLIINRSKKAAEYACSNPIVCSNYSINEILKYGFVIETEGGKI